jgi:hypothetical protein
MAGTYFVPMSLTSTQSPGQTPLAAIAFQTQTFQQMQLLENRKSAVILTLVVVTVTTHGTIVTKYERELGAMRKDVLLTGECFEREINGMLGGYTR